jgi:hypothetical protein
MKKTILFIIFLIPAITNAQGLINKRRTFSNDILQKTTPITITQNISVFGKSTSSINNFYDTPNDTSLTKHKLILYKTSSSSYNSATMSSTSSSKISGFSVDNGLNSYKFHHLMRELKPYVMDDSTTFRLYQRSRVYAGISKGATYFCFAAVLGGMLKILTAVSPKDVQPYYMAMAGGVGLTLVTGFNCNLSLKKCIKVHNQNAGFGYVSGLE